MGEMEKDGTDISKQPSRDMKLEALVPVVDGKLPAIFNAYRADDIDTAIRFSVDRSPAYQQQRSEILKRKAAANSTPKPLGKMLCVRQWH